MKTLPRIKRVICLLFLLSSSLPSAAGKVSTESHLNKLHRIALDFFRMHSLDVESDSLIYKEPKRLNPLPLRRTVVLSHPDSLEGFEKDRVETFIKLSKSIGLDPHKYIGKSLTVLGYLTKDSTWVGRKANAFVYFYDTTIAAANLSVGSIGGGKLALDDRSEFRPSRFEFPRFSDFDLDTVVIAGPQNTVSSNYEKMVFLTTGDELQYFSIMLASSKKTKADFKSIRESGNRYIMSVRFKTGEALSFIPFWVSEESVWVGYISGYYRLEKGFAEFIEKKMEEKGAGFRSEGFF
ncbi:MAG: hypothetical protein ACOCW1_03645 [Chitinispirillaceae bacterium]